MKIIDLLNKIANGEEVPKRIKWEDTIYAYSDYDKDYLEFPFSEEEYQGLFCMKDSILTQYLNDTVEILEEQKKIPEKLEYYDDSIAWVIDDVGQISDVDKVIIDKLNDVIDYLKSKGE